MTSLRKRVFAWMYHRFLSNHGQPDLDDPMTRDIRIPLLAQAHGAVLEIGAGDGANLPLYPAGVRVTLLDLNPYLLRRVTVESHNGYERVVANGEQLPFSNQAFDTVVSTHVLCSVQSQAVVLHEIRRVLRPGGRFLFMEHVAASPASGTYHLQRAINPFWQAIGDGCTLTRDTGALIRQAGFSAMELTDFRAGYPSFVSPHIVGVATK